MSTTTPVPTVPKVRTFASDLTATRALRGTAPRIKAAPVAPTPTAVSVTIPRKVVATIDKPTNQIPDEKINPPFHTLQKKVAPTTGVTTIDTSDFNAVAKKAKPSVLATPGIEPLTVNRSDREAVNATIITDTKPNRFSLFGSIGTSLTDWWQTKQQTATERKKPKYMVPEADLRKGVIQKATTQSGRTSIDDHEAVINRIKAAKKTTRGTVPEVRTTVTLPKTAIAEWGTDTEETVEVTEPVVPVFVPPTVTPAIPRPKIQPIIPPIPVTIQKVPGETRAKNVPIQTVIAPIIPRTPPTVRTSPEITAVVTPLERPKIRPTIPSIPTLTVTPVTEAESLPDEIETTATSAVTPVQKPNWSAVLNQDTIVQRPEVRFAQPDTETSFWKRILRQTNRLTLGVAAICGIIVIGYFGIRIALSKSTATSTPVVAIAPTTIFAASTPSTISVSTKQDIISALKAVAPDNSSFVEISLTHPGVGTPLSGAELLTLLGASAKADFTTSLNEALVGSYRGEPFLVFATTNGGAVQGGMLAWEHTLSSDLSPWFGPAILHSAKAGITLFHDSTIAGHDVRILSDDAGTDRITYGFITPTTLLITSNTTAFLNLAEKVQSGK